MCVFAYINTFVANPCNLFFCFLSVDLSSPCPDCGQICSTEFSSKEEGRFYPLLKKKVNCDNVMYRIAFCPFNTVRPPPRVPPQDLVKNFTMDGQCILGPPWYLDNSAGSTALRFSAASFNRLLGKDRRGINVNHYRDQNRFKPALRTYIRAIRGKHVAVVGTEVPWAEAILLNLGADKVTTIEYRELYVEHSRIRVLTPFRYASRFLKRTAEKFDATVTYSSIEHTGLGRYGDPLMPYGDMEAIAQIWCATKPAGYLFLALPMTPSRQECILQWNAWRRYGYVRMQHLTANWKLLDEIDMRDGGHFLYVLQKVE